MDLSTELFGVRFRNPVLLAAGTCGFGEEVASVIDLGALGGFVTKSVTLEPRRGNAAPRVAEFRAGMLNSIGLANPGARAVLRERLPWIRDSLPELQVFVSVAGHTPREFFQVVEILEAGPGFLGFELNLSCPNDERMGGLPFAHDPESVAYVVQGVRKRTDRPVLVKLAPNTPDLAPVVRAAEERGADGLTLVNTLPGLLLDPDSGKPLLGAGAGGMSGPSLRPVGVHATFMAARLTGLPLVGVGGIATGDDAVQYLLAGASLVQIGTASFWDPRSAERVVKALHRFGSDRKISSVSELVRGAHASPGPSGRRPRGVAPEGLEGVVNG